MPSVAATAHTGAALLLDNQDSAVYHALQAVPFIKVTHLIKGNALAQRRSSKVEL